MPPILTSRDLSPHMMPSMLMDGISIFLTVLVLAVWALTLVVRGRTPDRVLLVGIAGLELLLVVLLIGGLVQMVQTDHDFAKGTFVGYLAACVAIPPIAVLWSSEEPSRSGTAVLLVVLLVLPVMILRIQQVWAGPVG